MADVDAATTAATHVIWNHRYREHISSDAIAAEVLATVRPLIVHETLCWLQPDDPASLIACDRKRGHEGRHSWDDGEAETREAERQRIREGSVPVTMDGYVVTGTQPPAVYHVPARLLDGDVTPGAADSPASAATPPHPTPATQPDAQPPHHPAAP